MQITIPEDMEKSLRIRAEAAGFRTLDEYVLDLLAVPLKPGVPSPDALPLLRQLRREVPRMSASEIVELVNSGRNR